MDKKMVVMTWYTLWKICEAGQREVEFKDEV